MQCNDAKWAILVNDEVVPVPQRVVQPTVLKSQASVGNDQLLVRDHNSPHDPVVHDDQEVDLAHGNVFYTIPQADARPPGDCGAPPKLAYFVDDHPEITTNPEQTGESLRGLFGLASDANLVRDYESPVDESIAPSEAAIFAAGPVFITRRSSFKIIINGRPREVAERTLSFGELIALAYDSPPQGEFICWTITYRRGPCENTEGSLEEGKSVQLAKGMVFNVQWTDKS